MADPLDCLIDSARKNLKLYLHKRTKPDQALFIWRYYHEVDPKTGHYCRRQWFHRPPEPAFKKDKMPPKLTPDQKWYPSLHDADYDYYRDGTQSDSDEGRARNTRNARHLKKIEAMIIEDRKNGRPMRRLPWDWEAASEPVRGVVGAWPDPDELAEMDSETETPNPGGWKTQERYP